MTPAQVRAARKLVGWSRDRLAALSDVSVSLLQSYENGVALRPALVEKLEPIRATLEAADIEFTNGEGPGVKLKQTKA